MENITSPLRQEKYRRAFTLLEVSFAVAIFSLFAVGSIYAMTQANRFASNSRYRTLALAACQQKIDQVMTAAWSTNPGSTPAQVLRVDSGAAQTVGNVTTTVDTTKFTATTTEKSLPLNNDAFNAETGLSSAFTNYDVQVIDQRTTVISKLADCTGNTGLTSRLLRADVTVSYTYRGKPVSVSISALRTADDF
jgi:prepilin-type N-terminal cleavage/methylation domain-containing protein